MREITMRKMRRITTALISAAALTMLGAGGAQADGLLGDVLSPLVCGLQNNVVGNNNQISQAGTCHQAATTSTTPGGITGYEVIRFGSFNAANGGGVSSGIMRCPTGKRVLSGGVDVTSGNPNDLIVNTSGPNADGTAWLVFVPAPSTQVSGQFFVICANATS
jgi:hypothetical protein